MHVIPYPIALARPLVPGAIPLYALQDGLDGRPRLRWDDRCTAILSRLADRCSNAEIAERIAAETGLRFKAKTVSDRRAALGLESPRRNEWSAPLTRTRMIKLGRR